MPATQAHDDQDSMDRGPLGSATWLVVAFYGAMLALSAGIAWWRGYLERWPGSGAAWLPCVLGLGAGLAVVLLSRLCMRFEPFVWLTEAFSEFLRGTTDRQVVLFAALSGLGEEALFRGVLQNEFGLVVATVLFAALHVGPSRRYLVWTAFAAVVGLLLGTLYLWTGSLIAPIVAHGTINLFNLRYLARYRARSGETASGRQRAPSGVGGTWEHEDAAETPCPQGEDSREPRGADRPEDRS